jgi:Tn3 transposase DDE domain
MGFFAQLPSCPAWYEGGWAHNPSFENQQYRASGLNLVVAAIVLWNTVYLERSTAALREHGQTVDDTLLPHLAPPGWEHINLTGDHIWRQHTLVERGKFRPLRPFTSGHSLFQGTEVHG